MPDVPKQYNDRLDKYTPALFKAALQVWDIAREFECDKYVTESKDGLRITIEKIDKNAVQFTGGKGPETTDSRNIHN